MSLLQEFIVGWSISGSLALIAYLIHKASVGKSRK